MKQDIATMNNKKRKKKKKEEKRQQEEKGHKKKEKKPWLHNYWHVTYITYTKFYPMYSSII